jgi:hypothetical protein
MPDHQLREGERRRLERRIDAVQTDGHRSDVDPKGIFAISTTNGQVDTK